MKKNSTLIAPIRLVKRSLVLKLLLWIGIILGISCSLSFYFQNRGNREMLINQMKRETYLLGKVVEMSIYHDMLRAQSDKIQESLEAIGTQEVVKKVRIIKRGKITASSFRQELGMEVDRRADACYDCPTIEGQKPIAAGRYRFFTTEDREPVVGYVNPLYNKRECHSCHPAETGVVGVLDIVLSMEKVCGTLRASQKRSFIFILLCFLLIVGPAWLLILRFINKPITQLANGIQKITEGDLDHHIPNLSEDEIGGLTASFNRMTDDLRRYRDHLIQAKEYTDNIVESMTDALVVVDSGGRIKTVNQALVKLLRYEKEEELIGQSVGQIFAHPSFLPHHANFNTLITEGPIRNYDTTYKTKQGMEIPINLSASVMNNKEGDLSAVVCVARDMSEIQKLIKDLEQAYKEIQSAQIRLIESSRLASMGELAAGVAHEINNPMAVITLNAQFLKEKMEPDTRLSTHVHSILKQGKRITNMVKNLLSFARSDTEICNCSIRDVIDTSISFMKLYLVKDGISIKTSYESHLPRIGANPSQLEQVFINLLLNAKDALNEKYPNAHKNKIITIEVSCIKKEGVSYVRILFIDNGVGIEEKLLDKIFDPFVTTKKSGKGTGLGLSIIYRIITDHKGDIKVVSHKGHSTTFTIELPVRRERVRS